jgi:HD-GYP domain-containing protein (c-di-GMP phosphodiesterase class II)
MFTKLAGFFKPPEYDTIELSQKGRFLHYALLVTTVACLILALQNLDGSTNLAIALFGASCLSFICIPLNKHGWYRPIAMFICTLILVLITYSLIQGVGLKDAALIAYPIFIILSSYLFNKRANFFASLLSLGSIVFVFYMEKHGLINPAVHYTSGEQLQALFVLIPAVGFFVWVVVDNWEKIIRNLGETYDLTLAGWGRALELRDHETEGHSQRVMEMTLVLARHLGVRGRKLDHLRRGALLHDIGKMAIPDSILLKNGSLSEAEWAVVKQHPLNAKKMLENIPYLKPAIDIPYCHHERWNGSGYPQGLAHEDIPFAARIFAVVDVWDALTSIRPYRLAWTEDEARQYLLSQSGIQFDPQVVETFLNTMTQKTSASAVPVPAASSD